MRKTVLTVIVLMAAACGTVGNPFVRMNPDYAELPAEALRQAAREIEQAVSKGDREFALQDRDNLVLNTERIRQSVQTRAARAERLASLLDSGHAVEKPNGLVHILRTKAYKKATTSQERDRNALVVYGENNDRWALYEGIIKVNNLSQRALSAIQETFHNARVETMLPGQKYEEPSGTIVRKGA